MTDTEQRRTGIVDRIFFVDYSEMQRIEGFQNPVYACQVAIMMMFARIGLLLLTGLCVVWMKIERGLPTRYWIENLSENQTLFGAGSYVLIVYLWLYRRYSSYAFTPFSAQVYDTVQNRRAAKLSLLLAVVCPLLGWLAVEVGVPS
jgi:hypothetical protein